MNPRQTVTVLPVEQLTAHPGNIRNDLGDLADMAASIREHGIVQPLVATEHPDEPGLYRLLTGHRRLGGALLAGLTKVPVIIRHGVEDQAEQVLVMLVENTQRRDLNPVERAEAYGFLKNQGLSQSEIARRTGAHVSTVNYYLTLLDLDEAALEDVRDGELNSTDAVAAVRQARQAHRASVGAPARGRPKDTVKWQPAHFGPKHRLAQTVRRGCDHVGVRKVGEVGCGPCWEAAILNEDGAAREAPREAAREADTVLVHRFLSGEHELAKNTSRAEKDLITDAWRAAGRSLAELSRVTGWKEGRYGTQLETAGVA